ncbi:hypothetical protein AB4Y72_16490 [Arthrobacter sp. YAF34]|uniref:hypothetical protein n=1 Tax=Arthrobacter sp. YAF34 TaxID=3233083 RepID=UPI003F8FEC52
MEDPSPNGAEAPDHALLEKINSILKGQASPAAAHVRKLRTKHPRLTPAAILKKLETELLITTSAAGAAAGATSAAPGIGKAAALAITLGGPAVSLPAAVFYILAVAEVYQIPPSDIEHRRKLALSILLEQGADSAIPNFAKKTSQHWTRKTLKAIPGSVLKPINGLFHPNFITKTGPTGTIVLKTVLPYALGAVIGAGFTFATTSSVIAATRLAFGPPKPFFDEDILEGEDLPPTQDDD